MSASTTNNTIYTGFYNSISVSPLNISNATATNRNLLATNSCSTYPAIHFSLVYTCGCSLIISVTVLLNVYEIYAYCANKVKRTRFNLTLAHLSTSNALQAAGFLPYIFIDISKVIEGKMPGDGMVARLTCGVVHGLSLFFAFTLCNGFIIALLSVYRYRMIKQPLHLNADIENRHLAACWIFGIVWLLPNMFTFEYEQPFCRRNFGSLKMLGDLYKMGAVVFCLVIPIIVMVTSHLMTVHVLTKESRPVKRRQLSSNNAADQIFKKRRRKVTKTLSALVSGQVISWFPFNIYFLLMTVNPVPEVDICAGYKRGFTYKCVLLPSLLAPFWNVLFFNSSGKRYRKVLSFAAAQIFHKISLGNIKTPEGKH